MDFQKLDDGNVDSKRARKKTLPDERFDLPCGECHKPMVLCRSKDHGIFYRCSTYPKCDGAHGANPDGSPKGIPGNKATRAARIRAQQVFDRTWAPGGPLRSRRDAYKWLSKVTDLGPYEGIAYLNAEECETLIRAIYNKFPVLHTRWSRLAHGIELELNLDEDFA